MVIPPDRLFRVGRVTEPLNFSVISGVDAALPNAGNRFDVPGEGVCYLGSTATACYAETLARFRVTPRVREAVRDEDPHFMVCGGVPADWRSQRLIVECSVVEPLPFLDVEASTTHTYLTSTISQELTSLDVEQLDIAVVRGPNRLITRAIAAWAYGAVDEEGYPLYGGIRYVSRLGQHECWAVFAGSELRETSRSPVLTTDEALQDVATAFGLRIF